MTTIPPAGTGPVTPAVATPPEGRAGTAAVGPAGLPRTLVVGARLPAVVVGPGPDGRPQVAVGSSLLTLEGVGTLPAGTRLALAITAVAPRLEAEITIVGERAAPAAGMATTGEAGRGAPAGDVPATPVMRTATPTPAAPGPSAAAGSGDGHGSAVAPTATLLTPVAWRRAVPGGPLSDEHAGSVGSLPAGTRLGVRLLPAGDRAAVVAGQDPAKPAPMRETSQIEGARESAAAGADRSVASGSPIRSPAPVLSAGARIAATVSAVLPDGRAIVVAPGGGAFVLDGLPGLEPGATLELALGDPVTGAQTAGRAVGDAAGRPANAWAALEVLLRGPEGTTPDRASLVAVLPRPDASLGERIRAVLAAAASGDARELLGGETAERLVRHHPEASAALARDLERTARAAEPVPERAGTEGWIALALPLLVGTAIEPLQLLLRRGPSRSRRGDGGADERFVIEVTLGRLGRVQLDSMVRTAGESGGDAATIGRLDTVVRTEQPLDPAAREEIRALAAGAGDRTGVCVAVGFRSGPPGFVDPAPRRAGGPTGGVVA